MAVNRVFKNWSYLFSSDIIQQLLGFFILIKLARELSPEIYGLYGVILSLAAIFSVIANFGSSNVIIRQISLNCLSTKEFIKKIVFPFRFVSFLVAVLSLIVSLFFLETNHHGNLIFIIILILNYSIWNFSESVAFGHKETKYTSLLNVIFMSLWFIILFFLNDNLFNLYNVLIIFCIINFIKSFIYLFIILTNYYSDKYGCKTVITQNSFIGMNFTYFIIALIGTLSMELPTQFINNNSDSQDVGFYIVGVKLMLPISRTKSAGNRKRNSNIPSLKSRRAPETKTQNDHRVLFMSLFECF